MELGQRKRMLFSRYGSFHRPRRGGTVLQRLRRNSAASVHSVSSRKNREATVFDAITKDAATLAGLLRSLPVLEAPWDAEFQKRYCSKCIRADCDDRDECPYQEFRNNPEWWLALDAAGADRPRRIHTESIFTKAAEGKTTPRRADRFRYRCSGSSCGIYAVERDGEGEIFGSSSAEGNQHGGASFRCRGQVEIYTGRGRG